MDEMNRCVLDGSDEHAALRLKKIIEQLEKEKAEKDKTNKD